MPSLKEKRYRELRKTAKNQTEAARKAGYAHPTVAASKLEKRIRALGEKGLDTLERIADNGRNEIAVVQAGKTLVETAYGKPAPPTNQITGNIIISVNKLPKENELKQIVNQNPAQNN